jgi:hypothetical protein
MTEKTQHIHQILGISDEREEEIAKEVATTLTKAGRIDTGTKKLMETYPAEAMLAGMRLIQAINLNMVILSKRRIIHEQNRQNTDLN